MAVDDWYEELQLIEARGVSLAPGLSNDELNHVEKTHGFRFPPDLRSFLSKAMPLSKPGTYRFPDWRDPDSSVLTDLMPGAIIELGHTQL